MTKFGKILLIAAGLGLVSMPAMAYEKGDWILRGGVGMVSPESTAFVDSTEDLLISVDDGTSAVFTATYMFGPNWGFEILAAWPFSHDIHAGPVDRSVELKLGETKHLPPTFSFQYHFAPEAKFRPYAGLGLNYTTFFDEKLNQDLFPGFDMKIDDSFGLAAQLGADLKLNESWLLNVDVRYINIEPDVTLSDGVDSDKVSIDINPIVFSINVGYLF
jgi:outer membrane protein